MAKVSPEAAEVNARILYWGIEGAGKRTSLANVATKLRSDHRGEMREVPTRFDPSVVYSVLPIELGEIAGMHTRIEMVAVPGEPEQAPTRKLLLDQVDGVVFVADSQRERMEENVASFEELVKALGDYARRIEDTPLVVQYNKRDLADPYAIEELHRRLGVGNAAAFEAVATDGTGLLQTLSTISKKVIRALRGQSFSDSSRAPEPATRVDAPVPEPPAHTLEPAPEPVPQPSLELPPAEELPPAPARRMEEAILAEMEQPEASDALAQADAAEAILDQPWHHGVDDLDAPLGARVGPDLSIVSVGEATRIDDRSVRVPLVLGDGEGETSTLVLTFRLDALLDEGSG
jgi:signal recognition particle receptor subunit beta